jgi:hypothetical protein
MKKYEYSFVAVTLKGGFWTGEPEKETYREVILEKGLEGWRFVQAYSPAVSAGGTTKIADLIFEREIDERELTK